jgi:peptide/nickel transport system ATP-binding protein
MIASESPVIRAKGVRKQFTASRGLIESFLGRGTRFVAAVDGVDLAIARGEIVSLVGESGSGKTTFGEVVALLQPASAGTIVLDGTDVTHFSGRRLRRMRRHVQVIFQDPFDSLDPRMTVYRTLAEPVVVNEKLSKHEVYQRVLATLTEVGMTPPEIFLYRYPGELSGGQRQRVSIARALILRPNFVVADEPVSMLDVSVAAGILNLMLDLRSRHRTAFLLITHDLGVARYIGDRIATMFRGKIVEVGPADAVVSDPLHPYTRQLMSAVPIVDAVGKRTRIETTPTSAAGTSEATVGCRYQLRCPWVKEVCRRTEPDLLEIRPGHFAACFRYGPSFE